MGRVKHYARSHGHKHKKRQDKKTPKDISDDVADPAKPSLEALSVGKKKQLFKKEKARDIKSKIQELKLKSGKLKKKNLEQKAEKKKLAKEIHRLKASLKACEDIPKKEGEESDSDEDGKMLD